MFCCLGFANLSVAGEDCLKDLLRFLSVGRPAGSRIAPEATEVDFIWLYHSLATISKCRNGRRPGV